MSEANENCKEQVRDTASRWPRYYQCSRKAVKDGFCNQHHPDAKKKRNEAALSRYEQERMQSPYARLNRANTRLKAYVELLAAMAQGDADAVELVMGKYPEILSDIHGRPE